MNVTNTQTLKGLFWIGRAIIQSNSPHGCYNHLPLQTDWYWQNTAATTDKLLLLSWQELHRPVYSVIIQPLFWWKITIYFWWYPLGSSINDVTPKFRFFDPPPSPCHPMSPLPHQPPWGDITSGFNNLPPPPPIHWNAPLLAWHDSQSYINCSILHHKT